MHVALECGLTASDFWASTPRAIILLSRARIKARSGGKEAAKPAEKPKLNRIPR